MSGASATATACRHTGSGTPMKQHRTQHRTPLLIASLLALPLCIHAAPAQSPIKKLPAADGAAIEKTADRRLLPSGADQLEFQPDQAVSLAGSPPLKVMPVRFKSPGPAGSTALHFQCGFFLVAANSPTTFLPAFGTDWTASESCDGLNAIGLVDPAPSAQTVTPGYPDILVIFQAYTPAESFPEPVLLTWDAATATYRADALQSQWLNQQKEGHTIPGARQLLATRIRK